MTDRQRRFRFGVVGESIRSSEQLAGTARRAEELGYSTLVLRDHFVREPFGDQLAPMVALMAAAGVTSTLRVGTLVLDNDYRHPVLLAKEAATLDLLSGGRLELGITAGAERLLRMPSLFVGPVDRIAEEMRARRERYGFSYCLVSDREMEASAPVVERLADR